MKVKSALLSAPRIRVHVGLLEMHGRRDVLGCRAVSPCNSLITESRESLIQPCKLQSLVNQHKALPALSPALPPGGAAVGEGWGGQCSLLVCFQNPRGHHVGQDLNELCLGLSSQSGAAAGIVEISLFNRLKFLWSFIRLL